MKGKIINYFKQIDRRILLIFIVLFGLTLRLIFFSGYVMCDDKYYLMHAYLLSIGKFEPLDFNFGLRIGLLAPTAFFFNLFGINEFSLVLFPLLCSIGGIILIYYFGRLFFDEKVGLAGAFLLSFFPLDVIFATHLYPDIPLTFFISLCIFSFLKGESNEKKWYYLLSGIFIGIAYLIKISTFTIIFFFVFYMLYKKRIKINYLFIPLGFLLILCLESSLYYFCEGDFLYRYHSLNHWGKIQFIYPIHRGSNWIIEPFLMLTIQQEFGFFYYFILPIIAYFLIKRNNKVNILLLWTIPIFLYIEYGSTTISRYLVLERVPRHLSIITLPSLLILAYFLVRKLNKKFLYSFLIFLLLTSIGCCWVDNSRIKDYLSRQIYTFHKNNPDKDLIISSRDYIALLFYSKMQINPNLKIFYPFKLYPDGYKSGYKVRVVKLIYPNVQVLSNLYQIHNAHIAMHEKYFKKYSSLIPSSAKLIKTIRKPKRFYYSILQKGIFKKIFNKLMGKRKYPFEESVQIYYIP
ncbi:MAG: glycosyltransferase family 39 protein [bacterium]